MPRFTIKDLMMAMLLVAVGLSIEIVLFNSPYPPQTIAHLFLAYFVLCSGLAVIVAGLLAPFRIKKWGAAIGFMVGVAFVALMWLLVVD